MNIKSYLLSALSIAAILTFNACSKEDDPIPLVANAGDDISATVATTVTLDGSKSTGPQGFTYQWSYQGSPAPDMNNINSANATFVPMKNGTYTFKLRIEHNGQFNEDEVTVTVTGILSLPATISANFTLQDIEPDPTKPDYQANGLVTLQGGLLSSSVTQGLTIQFAENAGLVIEGGTADLTGLKLTSTNGWKGIALKGGTLNTGSNTQLEKAGKSTFDGQTETASIVMTGGTIKLNQTTFSSSSGTYDLLITGGNFSEDVFSTTFSTSIPIKSDIRYVSKFPSGNTMPANYSYILLTTPGALTVITSPYNNGFQFYAYKYLIDGDFSAGSNVHFNGGAQVFMKEGAGIFQSTLTLSSNGCPTCNPSTGVVIEGINGTAWKGIAIGAGGQLSLSGIELKKAGSALFSTGSFSSSVRSAIFFGSSSNGSIGNTKITDSQNYGLYIDQLGVYATVSNSTFTNSTNSAISVLANDVYRVIANTSNTFSMPANVAAVEVRVPNPSNNSPIGTWQPLGSTNYYLFSGHVIQSSPWTLSAGTRLKFKTGRSLRINASFTAVGTANEPILLDSEAGTTGTWSGVILESVYNMQYCQIKNGGELNIFNSNNSPSSEKANVVFNYGGIQSTTFKNNTITNSAGYGVLVEALKQNPDAGNAIHGNTFSGNTSGNIIVK